MDADMKRVLSDGYCPQVLKLDGGDGPAPVPMQVPDVIQQACKVFMPLNLRDDYRGIQK